MLKMLQLFLPEISRLSQSLKKREAVLALERRRLSQKSNPKASRTVETKNHPENEPNSAGNPSSEFSRARGASQDLDTGKRLQIRPRRLWKSASLQATFENRAFEGNNSSESDVDTVHFEIDE